MVVFPNAKINLGLHILSLRYDGYHNIETGLVEIGLCDVLEFIKAPNKLELKVTGIPVQGDIKENLVFKAWNLLHIKHSIPEVKIHLHKVIPQGAGLGGGSSDAAFMLKGLNEYFELNIAAERLKEYCNMLGSDCSFFIENKPNLLSGKGDILTPTPKFIENKWLCLFYPELAVSTANTYSVFNSYSSHRNLIDILFMDLKDWKDNLVNDFEEQVFKLHPVIAEIKQEIYKSGAIYASMSGSGSSVYGIYDEKPVLDDGLKKFLIWEERIA